MRGVMNAIMFRNETEEQRVARRKRREELGLAIESKRVEIAEASKRVKHERTETRGPDGSLISSGFHVVEDDAYKHRDKLYGEINELIGEHNSLLGNRETAHYASAKRLSNGKYYSEPTELFARAFESYVEDKLHEAGRASTYLVAGTRIDKNDDDVPVGVYAPVGSEERKAMNAAMDNLFRVLREHDQFSKSLSAIMGRR
jgi:hypothetical protein